MLAAGVHIQGDRKEADYQEGQPVDRDVHPFVGRDVQGVRDELGRERQERHHEQQDEVELQDDRSCPGKPVGQGRVDEPRAADRQEADDVRDEAGPGIEHLLEQGAWRLNRHLQYEQCGGDGEHAVAVCRQPVSTKRSASARRVCVTCHDTVSFTSVNGGTPNGDRPCDRQPGSGHLTSTAATGADLATEQNFRTGAKVNGPAPMIRKMYGRISAGEGAAD